MSGFLEGEDQHQATLFPERLDDYIAERLEDKITALKKAMDRLKKLEVQMLATPDRQISLTDPDARSMAGSGRGTGMVGSNVHTAVDEKRH